MDADARAFVGGKAIEDAVVEVDEAAQKLLRRLQLHRERPFREVDLHIGRAAREALPDITLGFAQQIREECVTRVTGYTFLRIQETERGSRNNRLFHRYTRVLLRLFEIGHRVRAVLERTGGEFRQLSCMTVGKGNRDPAWREGLESVDRRVGDTRLRQAAIRDGGLALAFEPH